MNQEVIGLMVLGVVMFVAVVILIVVIKKGLY